MAIAKLLNLDLCPRLYSLRDRHLHLPRRFEVRPPSSALSSMMLPSSRSERGGMTCSALPPQSMRGGARRPTYCNDSAVLCVVIGSIELGEIGSGTVAVRYYSFGVGAGDLQCAQQPAPA